MGLQEDKEELSGTAYFCQQFDTLFDCLNGRSDQQANRKAKPNLHSYRESTDVRFEKMINILKWLDSWKERLETHAAKEERAKAFIAPQTHHGLRMTVHSTIELTRYLLDVEKADKVFTSFFNQDALESYFSMVRNYQGDAKNSSVKGCTEAQNVIREIKAFKPGKGANTTTLAHLAD